MSEDNQINRNVLKVLSENIKLPFLALNKMGNIFSFNGEAASLFTIRNQSQNIFDLLTNKTSEEFNYLLEEMFVSKEYFEENFVFELKNGDKFKTTLSVDFLKDGDTELVICVIKPEKKKLRYEKVTQIDARTVDVKQFIRNKQLIAILNEIESFFPFTFIGKEKLRKKIDSLVEIFWITDSNGKFLLVNDKFCKTLGIKSSFVEGKPEETFIPAYLINFNQSIDKYLKQSLNCIILGGIPFQGLSSDDGWQTIEIPLADKGNNVIAVIGITQKASELFKFEDSKYWINPNFEVVKNLPISIAFIDNIGFIKHSSLEFCKLFSQEIKELSNLHYTQVFPIEISEQIKKFLDSSIKNEKLDVNKSTKLNKEVESNYFVYLNRIYDNENNSVGITVLIEQTDDYNDLQKIIIKRGRMFEVLIQNNPEPIFIYDKENLRFLEVNEAALNLYGYNRDEFLQLDLTDLYSPEDIQTLLESTTEGLKEGKFNGPFRQKKKDGTTILVEISKSRFKYNDKEAHFNIIRNISDKLDQDKKNQLFKAAFENTSDLLFVTDNTGFIKYINNSVSNNLGFSKNDLEDTSLAALAKDDERATINTLIFNSHLKETTIIETELKKNNGEFVEVEISATPVLDYDNEVESFTILGKIKHKESAPEEPKEVIKEIVKEVIVEKPVPVQDSSDITSTAFFSSVFHEILTPINVILGFVQELKESIENPTSEQKEASEIINQNRNTLLNAMNSVIEFSQIKQNSVELNTAEIGITEIIDELQKELMESLGSQTIEFAYGKISSSLRFETDKPRFEKLAVLLFKVASKLSSKNKLYFSAYPLNENSYLIAVRDNYSSISTELLNNFNIFFNADETTLAKDFNISRLTTRLTKSYLELLNGKFEVFQKDNEDYDCGFVFPVKFSDAVVEEEPDSTPEVEVEESTETITKENVPEEPAVEVPKEEQIESKIDEVQETEDVDIDWPDESEKFDEEVHDEITSEPIPESESYQGETESPEDTEEEISTSEETIAEEEIKAEQEPIAEDEIESEEEIQNEETEEINDAIEPDVIQEEPLKEPEPEIENKEIRPEQELEDKESVEQEEETLAENEETPAFESTGEKSELDETGESLSESEEPEFKETVEPETENVEEEVEESSLPEEHAEETFSESFPEEPVSEEEQELEEPLAEEPETEIPETEKFEEEQVSFEGNEEVEEEPKFEEPSFQEEETYHEEHETESYQETAEEETGFVPEANAPIVKPVSHVKLGELRCLYIEDQVDSQILYKVQMKELKEIKFAVSFEEALPVLDNHQFDFVVIDINLQGEYNGLDALKIIHKMSKYENVPIIAVTAYVLPGDKEKFIAAGFHDFISKPIFREKMIESLDRIFLSE